MACYWIALIPLRCSGNQATILLEALVLMANLVDLMVGSIQLGLVSERGGGSFSFNPSIRSHKSTEVIGQTGSISSVESIARLPSLSQSTLQPTVGVEADYSQRIDLQRLQSTHRSTAPTVTFLHLIPTVESLNLIPTRSTARITL